MCAPPPWAGASASSEIRRRAWFATTPHTSRLPPPAAIHARPRVQSGMVMRHKKGTKLTPREIKRGIKLFDWSKALTEKSPYGKGREDGGSEKARRDRLQTSRRAREGGRVGIGGARMHIMFPGTRMCAAVLRHARAPRRRATCWYYWGLGAVRGRGGSSSISWGPAKSMSSRRMAKSCWKKRRS